MRDFRAGDLTWADLLKKLRGAELMVVVTSASLNDIRLARHFSGLFKMLLTEGDVEVVEDTMSEMPGGASVLKPVDVVLGHDTEVTERMRDKTANFKKIYSGEPTEEQPPVEEPTSESEPTPEPTPEPEGVIETSESPEETAEVPDEGFAIPEGDDEPVGVPAEPEGVEEVDPLDVAFPEPTPEPVEDPTKDGGDSDAFVIGDIQSPTGTAGEEEYDIDDVFPD